MRGFITLKISLKHQVVPNEIHINMRISCLFSASNGFVVLGALVNPNTMKVIQKRRLTWSQVENHPSIWMVFRCQQKGCRVSPCKVCGFSGSFSLTWSFSLELLHVKKALRTSKGAFGWLLTRDCNHFILPLACFQEVVTYSARA